MLHLTMIKMLHLAMLNNVMLDKCKKYLHSALGLIVVSNLALKFT